MRSRVRRTALAALTLTSTFSLLAGAAASAVPDDGAAAGSAAGFSTSARASNAAPAAMPKVVDLRWGEHGTFDRVVIDLVGKRTGYRVGYVPQLTYDGSGEPVRLKGKRFIEVAVRPARAHNNDGDSLYTGPRRRQLELASLRGVAFTGDFEGVVSFGLAIDRKAPFRVFTLSQPRRLVIDVKH